MRAHWVRRDRQGSIVLRFEPVEIATLLAIVDDVRHVLETGAGTDAVSKRLFPRAYLDPTEEEAEVEWQALVQPDLLRTRLDALAGVTKGLATATETRRGDREIVLDDESEGQWLGVLNDARLAIGTALELTEETELDHFDADDPMRDQFLLYGALTGLQGELIEALLGEL
jgi:hypothetical protein